MPLAWKLDPVDRLMVAVANGDVTRPEVERFLDAIVESGALAYRKVFDVHKADMSMTAEDVLPLAVRIRSLHDLGRMGPLAMILPPGRGKRLQRMLGMLAAADRPMRVFEDPLLAWRWLAKQELPDGPAGRSADKDTLEWSAQTRGLTARIRRLSKTAAEEADKKHPAARDGEILYRGQADITHRGAPLNICVAKIGPSWEFRCCDSDRLMRGTLLTLGAEQIAASLAEGRNPLDATLGHLKGLAAAGRLVLPDTPPGTR